MRSRQSLIRHHPLFPAAMRVVAKLAEQGFVTVFAGGSVRDSLLGHTPQDLDLATSAPPEVVESSFAKTLAVGKAFGTIVVVEDGHGFEVTTFRQEGGYQDGRHPGYVVFAGMQEDAERRDFTVNALFYDPAKDEVLDFVDGLADLSAKVLRTVGNPEARFSEDYLRMLRAPRFVAQLGFELQPESLRAIQKSADAIAKVSAERVFAEMRRLLGAEHLLLGLQVLIEAKLASTIWPEIEAVDWLRLRPLMPFLNWENAFSGLMLLADSSASEERLRAWKAPRESIGRVRAQMDGARTLVDSKSRRADRVRVLGSDTYAESLLLAEGMVGDSGQSERWIREFLEVSGEKGKLPKPFLNGQDLLDMGIPAGETMGRLLKALYDQQLEGSISSRSEALEKARQG